MKLKKICEILKDREITENCFKRQDSDGISKDTMLTPITPFIVQQLNNNQELSF